MRRFIKECSLSLVFGLLFLLSLVGQALAGSSQFNNAQHAAGLGLVSLGGYLTSVTFAADVTENWQSEYLQFTLFILATVWFLQKGSPESTQMKSTDLETDKAQKLGEHVEEDSPASAKAGGVRTTIFSWSLTSMMAAIFLVSWFAQSVAGWASFNQERLERLQHPLTWVGYVTNADFWSRTLQNWQSEFLAVGSMAVLSIFLRQRASSQSKPVGEPHASTGVSG